MKKCESGDHSEHPAATHESATALEAVETEEHTAVTDTTVKADTTSAVKPEAPAHH
jgi:hypothetical protein